MSFGTGTTYFSTLCGALCTAHRLLQAQGVPSSATREGFRVGENICVEVLRSLRVPITHAFIRNGDQYHTTGSQPSCHSQHHDDSRRTGGIEARRHSGNLAVLVALAAGLQHEVVDSDTTGADREAVRHYELIQTYKN